MGQGDSDKSLSHTRYLVGMGSLLLLLAVIGAFLFHSTASLITGGLGLLLLVLGLAEWQWSVIGRLLSSPSIASVVTSAILLMVALAMGFYGWRTLREGNSQRGRAGLIAGVGMLFVAGLNTAILVAARLEQTRGSGGRLSAWLLKYRRDR